MGRLDVDEMLEEMSPAQFTEWRAALDVLGLDDQWQQAGTVCETIYTELHELAAAFNSEETEADARKRRASYPKAGDFVPLLRKPSRQAKPAAMDHAQQIAAMRGMCR